MSIFDECTDGNIYGPPSSTASYIARRFVLGGIVFETDLQREQLWGRELWLACYLTASAFEHQRFEILRERWRKLDWWDGCFTTLARMQQPWGRELWLCAWMTAAQEWLDDIAYLRGGAEEIAAINAKRWAREDEEELLSDPPPKLGLA